MLKQLTSLDFLSKSLQIFARLIFKILFLWLIYLRQNLLAKDTQTK